VENPKPPTIYTQALVTFIDILGFREMVQDDPTGCEVKQAVHLLRHYGTADVDERSHYGFTAYNFSDSVVRCNPLGEGLPSSESILIQEIEELTYIQGELIRLGILVRGGIAYGDVYFGEQEVFGPAFIDAYTLESKHACYPRILIHPNLITNHATRSELGYGIHADDGLRLTRDDNDGFQFIDYLNNFPREMHSDPGDEREEMALSYMIPRQYRIKRGISKFGVLSTERPKYLWLGNYHDIVAKELLGNKANQVLTNTNLHDEHPHQ